MLPQSVIQIGPYLWLLEIVAGDHSWRVGVGAVVGEIGGLSGIAPGFEVGVGKRLLFCSEIESRWECLMVFTLLDHTSSLAAQGVSQIPPTCLPFLLLGLGNTW